MFLKHSKVVEVYGPADFEKLPCGFFRIRASDGTESLGYRSMAFGVIWKVRDKLTLGGTLIKLDRPRAEVPLVRVNFRQASGQFMQIGNALVVYTQSLDEFDGAVEYERFCP